MQPRARVALRPTLEVLDMRLLWHWLAYAVRHPNFFGERNFKILLIASKIFKFM